MAFFRFLLYKSLAMRFGILLVVFSCLFSCSDIEKDRQVKKINVLTLFNLENKLEAIITPIRPPWKDIPPFHTNRISIGLLKKYSKL